MSRDDLDQWLERAILILTLAILVLMPLAFGGRPQSASGSWLDPILLDPFVAAELLMLPVLGLWLARLWITPKPRLLWPPVCWAVLAFAGYAVYRYSTSEIEFVARQELLRVLFYAVLFFVVVNNLHGHESTQWISSVLIFVAMGVSFYALFQYFTNSDRVWHLFKPYPHRGTGTYINPNHLGGFLELLLPLALAYTLISRTNHVLKVFLGYASLVLFAGVVVTMSRGTWLAVTVSLALFFVVLLRNRTYRIPAAIALVLLLGAGLFFLPKSYSFQARIKQLYTETRVDDDARFALWQPAIEIWRLNPWWGVGPGHFDYAFRAHRPEDLQARPERVHNDYLNALTDWGVVGAALIAAAWGLLAFGIIKTWPHVKRTPKDIGGSSNSSKFAFVLGASLGLVAILVHSVVDFNLHIEANAMLAVALMAMVAGHLRFAGSGYWFSLGWLTKSLASLALIAAVLYLGGQSWRRLHENYWLAKAAKAQLSSPAQVALLKKAFAAEPMNSETAYAIGEALRYQSSQIPSDYQDLATEATDWFDRALKLNPFDASSAWRYGWCLDWLERSSESQRWFDLAEKLDPNGYFTIANIGIHYVETGNLAFAKRWFERSLALNRKDNVIAERYLRIVSDRLQQKAGLLPTRASATP